MILMMWGQPLAWPVVGEWMLVLAAVSGLMPVWQLPQVAVRFWGATDERGSLDGRIRWAPWQEAQLATVLSPARLFRPW